MNQQSVSINPVLDRIPQILYLADQPRRRYLDSERTDSLTKADAEAQKAKNLIQRDFIARRSQRIILAE